MQSKEFYHPPHNVDFSLLPESNLAGKSETGAEHLLIRANESHIMDGKLQLCVPSSSNAVLYRDRVFQPLGHALADINVVVHFVLRVA